MKRKFAFLLAGCLILSPISAGMISDPALAAETESSADKVPSEFSVTAVIRDGSDTVLDTEQEYNMNLDETFQIIAQFDQDSASSIPSPVFSSDAPDIVSISGDGEVNALSPGTAHIMIEFPDIPAQDSLRYTICVSEPEEEEAAEAFEEEAAAADTSQETAAAEEPADASTEEAASADTSQETAAAEEPADASTEESAAAADTSQEAAAVEAPADAPTEEAAAPETAKVGTAAVKKAPAAKEAAPSVSGWVRSGSSWSKRGCFSPEVRQRMLEAANLAGQAICVTATKDGSSMNVRIWGTSPHRTVLSENSDVEKTDKGYQITNYRKVYDSAGKLIREDAFYTQSSTPIPDSD